jgi:O-antigen/teichoic acid export membrane protein
MTIFRSAFFVLLITNSASLFQWVFQLTMARVLQPAEFSVISAVTSLGPAVFSLFTILPQLISRAMIETGLSPLSADQRLKALKRLLAMTYLPIVVVYALLIQRIALFLKLDTPIPVIIYLFTSATHIFLLYFSGRFQGYLLFVPVALKTFFMAVIKLVLGLFFTIRLSLSYHGALLAELAANALTAAGMGFALHRYESRRGRIGHEVLLPPEERKRFTALLITYAGPIIAVSWVSSLMISIDMHLAKHFLSPFDAGLYSASATFGRISFFFAESLTLIVYPRVLKNIDEHKSSRQDILILLLTTFSVSFGISMVQTVFGKFLLGLFYGEVYAQTPGILITISWSMTMLSVINILSQYLLAERFYRFIVPNLLTIIGAVGFIWFRFHVSGIEIALGHLGGTAVMLVILLSVFFLRLRTKAGSSSTPKA